MRENQRPEIQKKQKKNKTEPAGQRDAQVQRLFRAEREEKKRTGQHNRKKVECRMRDPERARAAGEQEEPEPINMLISPDFCVQ